MSLETSHWQSTTMQSKDSDVLALEESSIERMLELGANPNTIVAGWTPLTYATMFGDHKVAIMLLDKGADPNLQSEGILRKITPLHMAMCGEMTSLLMERGADPELRMEYCGSTALLCAIKAGNEEVVTQLLSSTQIMSLNDNCETAISLARSLAREGGSERRDILQRLMKERFQNKHRTW